MSKYDFHILSTSTLVYELIGSILSIYYIIIFISSKTFKLCIEYKEKGNVFRIVQNASS